MLSQWYHIYNVLVLFPSGAQLTLVTGPFLINRTKLKSKVNPMDRRHPIGTPCCPA
jgi:hypothetical protein